MSDVLIKEIDGFDVVQYQPRGVCAKMMQFRIKENIIEDVEFVGGCNGNLRGISILVKGMHINDVIPKLSGLPCGSRPTSCPDQLTKGLEAYIQAKQALKI
ncbi:MAG: TIGR03905 family TSCPD domain-containing protein [Cyanobacteria bacterium SIG31]|nr:TIGR03905 family TSCPD domain-containing protein [Cyanobacteria bacterium SIG31]